MTFEQTIRELNKEIAELKDQLAHTKSELKTCQDTAIAILTNHCKKHPNISWEKLMSKIGNRCHFCDVEMLENHNLAE